MKQKDFQELEIFFSKHLLEVHNQVKKLVISLADMKQKFDDAEEYIKSLESENKQYKQLLEDVYKNKIEVSNQIIEIEEQLKLLDDKTYKDVIYTTVIDEEQE